MTQNKYRAAQCKDTFGDGCELWIVVDTDNRQSSFHFETEREAAEEALWLNENGPRPDPEFR